MWVFIRYAPILSQGSTFEVLDEIALWIYWQLIILLAVNY